MGTRKTSKKPQKPGHSFSRSNCKESKSTGFCKKRKNI